MILAEEVYGFDRARAETLKAIADHPRVINQLNLQRRRPNASQARYVYPPAGGIPAAVYNSATKKLVFGRATCQVAEYDPLTGQIQPSANRTEVVENQVTSVIGTSGKPMTITFNETTGFWEVIVEDCSGASTGTGITTGGSITTASTVDPISHGTASSLSMGYGYEGI
ncbi:MAG: hypothetical protein U0930_03640 [Pirellulales bacterium]